MKRRRELGQEYTMRSGGVAPARSRADRRQCKSKGKECAVFSEVDRLLILQHRWKLSWSEKRNFVYGLVDRDNVGRKRSVNDEKKKENVPSDTTIRYYLKIKYQRKPVRLKMFVNTTGLSKHFNVSLNK
ncbi:hypothetical protein ElyMa_003473200 [Elysia marginata]|uniref:Uncharacterized protein n=1 Tax=Elysia marginata TaxID=1093978 RepID=A0AAV4EAW3_9GAST|nr:hypothetical protein ElyMa_003473200 [Elysia marginata]